MPDAVPGRLIAEVVAKNIRDARRLADLSQEALAERMSLFWHDRGWHRATVSELERGNRSLSADELWYLAWVLEVKIGDLLDAKGLTGRETEPVRMEGHARGAGQVKDFPFWLVHAEDASAIAHSRSRPTWDVSGKPPGRPGDPSPNETQT